MIVDLNHADVPEQLECDVCIAGGGAAGITIAQALLGSGLKVCLLESGGFAPEAATQSLYQGSSVGHPVTMDVGRYRIWGGSTTQWTGRCAQLDPVDFTSRDWIPHTGWPIDRAVLENYYRRAEAICGFKEPWIADEEVDDILGIRLPSFPAGEVKPFYWRYAPLGKRVYQNWGVAFRSALDQSRDITVLLHANLVSFSLNDRRDHLQSVEARSLEGKRVRVAAKTFAICCGGIENARLLLSSDPDPRKAIGNAHDQVGRYFMQHPRGVTAHVKATREQSLRLQRLFNIFGRRSGVQYEIGFALAEGAQRRRGLLNCSAILQYHADPDSGWEAAKRLGRSMTARSFDGGVVNDLRTALADPKNSLINLYRQLYRDQHALLTTRDITLLVDLEEPLDAESRVTLLTDRDRLGMPLAKVDWRLSEDTRRTAREFTQMIGAMFSQTELGEVEPEAWLTESGPISEQNLAGTYHHIATTRMSDAPTKGVVDADCRVHGVNNLYIAGCSVFATGGHANPTFTIVALALRLADTLRTRL